MSTWDWLADTAALTPHGFCLFWDPLVLWLEAGSDAVIMLAYFSIPLAILWFLHRRRDLPHRWIAGLFVAFILACGTTHGLTVLTLWVPAYHLEASVKLVTAVLSICTAVALWPLVPQLLALPSAASMARLNQALENTLAERERTAAALRASRHELLLAQEVLRRNNAELEDRIAARTGELTRLYVAVGKSEARFRQVVESAPNAIAIVSQTGRIEIVNTQIERLFGYARAELLGQPVQMLLADRLHEGFAGRLATLFAQRGVRSTSGDATQLCPCKDGGTVEVEIWGSAIETEDGPMAVFAFVDISDRVRMEAALRQSQKMDAIGRVAAGVAHDFNNLLLALGGSLELLLDQVSDRPKAIAWGEVALRAVGRGGELTDRLLSFARKQVLDPRPVAVQPLFEDVTQLIRHLFETSTGARTELLVEAAAPGLALLADPGQLEAALINLAVNARDAMLHGGSLRISACEALGDPARVEPGRYVVVTVADTGSGMDAPTLAQACEPFFTTKGSQGTGLGLSMVQGFAQQSGGEARISSTPGVGTTIELWLPAAGAAAVPEPAAGPVAQMVGRVLVADDSEDALLVVQSFLQLSGLDVTVMSGGEAVLAALQAGRRFDVLVSDFAMPGLNGLDLLRQAGAIDPAMGRIIITGFPQPDLLAPGETIAILRKPFKRGELLAAVRQALPVRERV